jgi:hypothetical protein
VKGHRPVPERRFAPGGEDSGESAAWKVLSGKYTKVTFRESDFLLHAG